MAHNMAIIMLLSVYKKKGGVSRSKSWPKKQELVFETYVRKILMAKLYIEKAFGSSIVNRELGIEPVHVHM